MYQGVIIMTQIFNLYALNISQNLLFSTLVSVHEVDCFQQFTHSKYSGIWYYIFKYVFWFNFGHYSCCVDLPTWFYCLIHNAKLCLKINWKIVNARTCPVLQDLYPIMAAPNNGPFSELEMRYTISRKRMRIYVYTFVYVYTWNVM